MASMHTQTTAGTSRTSAPAAHEPARLSAASLCDQVDSAYASTTLSFDEQVAAMRQAVEHFLSLAIQGLPNELAVRIFGFLDTPSLLTAEQVCSAWRSLVSAHDDPLWHRLAVGRFPMCSNDPVANIAAPLHRSFPSWKAYYGNHNSIATGRSDFFSMKGSFVIHRAGWDTIRDRSLVGLCPKTPIASASASASASAALTVTPQAPDLGLVRTPRLIDLEPIISPEEDSLLASNASMDHIPGGPGDRSRMRFLMIWPVKPEHQTSIILDGTTIYWAGYMDERGDMELTPNIEALDLAERRPARARFAMKGHAAAIKMMVGNGIGSLVSGDVGGNIKVWSLAERRVAFDILPPANQSPSFVAFDIHKTTLAIMHANSTTHVWDICNRVCIAKFDLLPRYAYSVHRLLSQNRSEVHVAVRDAYIGIGMSEGTYLIHEMTPSAPATSPPRQARFAKNPASLAMANGAHAGSSLLPSLPSSSSSSSTPELHGRSRSSHMNGSIGSGTLGLPSAALNRNRPPATRSASAEPSPSTENRKPRTRPAADPPESVQPGIGTLPMSVSCICNLRDDDIDNHGFTYAPQTFCLGTHFVVTNGAYPDELSVWTLSPAPAPQPPSLSKAPPPSPSVGLGRTQSASAPYPTHQAASLWPLSVSHTLTPPVNDLASDDPPPMNPLDTAALPTFASTLTATTLVPHHHLHHHQHPTQSASTLPPPLPPAPPSLQPQPQSQPPNRHHARSRHAYAASETCAMQRQAGHFVPPFRDLKHARLDPDESMMVSSVEYEGQRSLFVWDYRVLRSRERRFELCRVGGRELWICFDVLEEGEGEGDGDGVDVGADVDETAEHVAARDGLAESGGVARGAGRVNRKGKGRATDLDTQDRQPSPAGPVASKRKLESKSPPPEPSVSRRSDRIRSKKKRDM